MSDIKIKCVDQTLTFVNAPVIASGGVIEDRVVFDFCPLWNGYVKTAVFYRDKTEVFYKLLEADDSCDIPAEVLASSGIVYIGVFGVKDESRRTSELLAYSIREGAVLNIAPTVDVYAQILEALANTKIVSGTITTSGHLVFTKEDGTTVDVGSGISLTDEQVNTALTEWLEINAEQTQLTTINAAFITKIREMHKKGLIRFWVGTKAEYEGITPEDNVFYVLTDEDPLTEITQSVEQNAQEIGAVANDVISLETTVNELKTNGTDELIADDNGWTVQKFASGAYIAWILYDNTGDTSMSFSCRFALPSIYNADLPAAAMAINQSGTYNEKIDEETTKYHNTQVYTVMLGGTNGSITITTPLSFDSTSCARAKYYVQLTGRWK